MLLCSMFQYKPKFKLLNVAIYLNWVPAGGPRRQTQNVVIKVNAMQSSKTYENQKIPKDPSFFQKVGDS
jgi:hypothetical protein